MIDRSDWFADPLWLLALTCAALACVGVVQVIVGLVLVRRFADAAKPAPAPSFEPVTVLKPLFGAEPLLEEALASFCQQDHAPLQIVFGVRDADDLAIAVARRVMARFPDRDIALVVDPTPHGRNRKVANLINMAQHARYDVLLISDSDVHVASDTISRLLDALDQPGVGLVTAPYGGRPATNTVAAHLGVSGIGHGFLPGTLMARALGRRDCLGATMAIRRSTLDAVGGLPALSRHVADDHMLGLLVQQLGLDVAMARCVPVTTVPETSLRDLFQHELRWSRTIASFVPLKFAASAVQYPIAWALLAFAATGFDVVGFTLVAAVWLARAVAAVAIDRMLALTSYRVALLLLPLRDVLSLAVVVATFAGTEIKWRGEVMHARRTRLNTLDTLPIGNEPR